MQITKVTKDTKGKVKNCTTCIIRLQVSLVISCAMEHILEFLPTKRGGRTLNLDGFHFRYKKSADVKTYWQSKSLACWTSAILLNDQFFSSSG